jgi:hypothetical protein
MAGLAAVAVLATAPQLSAAPEFAASQLELASPDLVSDMGLKSGSLDLKDSTAATPEIAASGGTDVISNLVPFATVSSLANQNFLTPALKTTFADSTIPLTSDVHLQLGGASEQVQVPGSPMLAGLDQLELSRIAQDGGLMTGFAGVDWSFASWGNLDISASQSQLGYAAFEGPLMLQSSNPASVTTIAISARLNLGNGWVTSISYDQGRTQLDLRSTGAVRNDARGYGIAVAKYGLFGEDSLGLAMIRPVAPLANELASQNSYSGLLGNDAFSEEKPETDLQLGYETSFNGNITLEANAGYQMNVGGQPGTKALSVLSRAKINF